VLDVAAGTGRVALAFARLGCQIVAVDAAIPMLNELRRKAPGDEVQVVAGEGARLPFAKDHFDAVIFARTLYLMSDWRTALREAYGLLKPGGRLLHEWGNGEADEAWVQIREKARTLFQRAGAENPFHPGARSESEVDAFILELGLRRTAELSIGPGPSMTLRDFLSKVASGEVSYIWSVSEQIRDACLAVLKQWCEDTFDLELAVPIPRDVCWTIYRK
jgi:SAM-dependent methyltransferase